MTISCVCKPLIAAFMLLALLSPNVNSDDTDANPTRNDEYLERMEEFAQPIPLTEREETLLSRYQVMNPLEVRKMLHDPAGEITRSDAFFLYLHTELGLNTSEDKLKLYHLLEYLSQTTPSIDAKIEFYFRTLEDEETSPYVASRLINHLFKFFTNHPSFPSHRRLAKTAERILNQGNPQLQFYALNLLILPQDDSDMDRERVRRLIGGQENIFHKAVLYRMASLIEGNTFALLDGATLYHEIDQSCIEAELPLPGQIFFLCNESIPLQARSHWAMFISFVETNINDLRLCMTTEKWDLGNAPSRQTEITED